MGRHDRVLRGHLGNELEKGASSIGVACMLGGGGYLTGSLVAGRILERYYDVRIFEADPTSRLDLQGVGKLMKIATEGGRETRPDIKLGICGEHGGDPSSVRFCHSLGFSYVSCSPFRVPIARLAAAQAAIEAK